MLTHIDLFSGIGGFALAARWAGFKTVAFVEIEPYAQEIIKQNFGAVADAKRDGHTGTKANETEPSSNKPSNGLFNRSDSPRLYSDIRSFPASLYRGATLLTGGFPCQPFSQAGKRRGKKDDRYLWPEMLRVIHEARPAWVLGENVAGIVQMELDRVLSDLEGEGYTCQSLIIPACAVDAKHRRDRVWIVGHAKSGTIGGKQQRRNGMGQEATSKREAYHDHADRPNQAMADAEERSIRAGLCESEQGEERGRRSGDYRWPDEADWFAQSGMGRVAYGIPGRIHRLKALGNAIVPQVAYEIIVRIRDLYNDPSKVTRPRNG